LAAESVLSAELGEQDEADTARVAHRVSAIDRELREHAVAAARAAALRSREMPTLQAALDKVRAELGEPGAHAEADGQVTKDEMASRAGAKNGEKKPIRGDE
ncbi:MAG TPA: hypothetical protein VE197_09160, partial [Mycobacterium sp.]|nr:hypothetical protein [Mycobacterium sp.]